MHDPAIIQIKPDVFGGRQPMLSNESYCKMNIALILGGQSTHVSKKGRAMASDVDKASDVIEDALSRFSKLLSAFYSKQDEFCQAAKKASGKVRESANGLSEGLSKIERVANFDRLERYVSLLERASIAMNGLAELEESGRLQKIADALK